MIISSLPTRFGVCPLEVVILDVDNTLVEDGIYKDMHNHVLWETMRRPEMALTDTEWQLIGSASNEEAYEFVVRKAGVLSASLPTQPEYLAMARYYFDAHVHETQMRPNAINIVNAIRELGLLMGVATNADLRETKAKLRAPTVALLDDIKFFSTLDGKNRPKPSPDLIHDALAKAGAFLGRTVEPSAALVVDDSIKGVHASLAVGCQISWWQHGAGEALFIPQPANLHITQHAADVIKHMRALTNPLQQFFGHQCVQTGTLAASCS